MFVEVGALKVQTQLPVGLIEQIIDVSEAFSEAFRSALILYNFLNGISVANSEVIFELPQLKNKLAVCIFDVFKALHLPDDGLDAFVQGLVAVEFLE